MRPVLYIARKLPDEALRVAENDCEVRLWDRESEPVPRNVLLDQLRDAEGLVSVLTERVDDELLKAAPRLKVVANMAVGYDNIDVEACRRHGVIVTNTPDVLTETTADLAWALLLATARRLPQSAELVRDGGWTTWSPLGLTGVDVYGKSLGILGMGRIGEAVARRAQGFGMTILYHNRRPRPEVEERLGARYLSLDALLREADILVILTPLTAETRHLIGRNELAKMKSTAILVNVSRGPVVDEEALVDALRNGVIWGAGLDVYEREPIGADHPLLQLDNAVCLPHIGSATVATRTAMARLAVQNAVNVLKGEKPLTPV
ncbi:MAG: D-glycerate dehydrogenase [Kyrpidia tusciae]|nr:D-glycerate dehydrogenase [Kyrpidia tusciae]MBE3553290.1 D-glycerate dehydrogenase [Kyrpidia tusciae]